MQSHYESLSRVIRFTRMADTKAGSALALQFLLLGALVTQSESLFSMVAGGAWDLGHLALIAVMLVYALFLLLAVGLGVSVYIPAAPKTGKSLIYFEDIAALKYDDFKENAQNMDDDTIEEQLISQIYQVSQIVSRKMRLVRVAFWSSAVSTLLGISLLTWASIQAQPT